MGLGYTKAAMRYWGGYGRRLITEDISEPKESWGAHDLYACQEEDLQAVPRHDKDEHTQG
jgi:hypothetical protein